MVAVPRVEKQIKECGVVFGGHLCQSMSAQGFACVFACRAARHKDARIIAVSSR